MIAHSYSPSLTYEDCDPDVRLMLRLRDGDLEVFETLMRRYEDKLHAFINKIINGRPGAEDLVQEVFLRVFRSRKSYRPQAKFSTWLFKIARNVAATANQKNRREMERFEACRDAETYTACEETQPYDRLEQAEMRKVVRMAIADLNERQRTAVSLFEYDERTYANVAKAMDISEVAAKSLLHRARLNLRDRLAPYMSEGRITGISLQ